MEIIDIFDNERLLSFRYNGEKKNEYDRLMDFWTNVYEVRKYGKANGITDRNKLDDFVKKIGENAEYIQDLLDDIENGEGQLQEYFEPLDGKESIKMLNQTAITKQKGKRYILRIYALRIDEDTFIITGGAIKQSEKMDGHIDTKKELVKLEKAVQYFIDNDVFDTDSLKDFRNEDD